MAAKMPIILHPGGVHTGDQGFYARVPVEADAPVVKPRDPPVGSFIRFCALPGMTNADGSLRFGYLNMLKQGQTDTRANKERLILFDCPDGA